MLWIKKNRHLIFIHKWPITHIYIYGQFFSGFSFYIEFIIIIIVLFFMLGTYEITSIFIYILNCILKLYILFHETVFFLKLIAVNTFLINRSYFSHWSKQMIIYSCVLYGKVHLFNTVFSILLLHKTHDDNNICFHSHRFGDYINN